MSRVSGTHRVARYERDLLLVTIPELWAANIGLIGKGGRQLFAALAERAGRDDPQPELRVLVDAVVGVGLGALFDWADDPATDGAAALDDAIARLEAMLTF